MILRDEQSFLAVMKQLQVSYSNIYVTSRVIENLSEVPPPTSRILCPPKGSFQRKQDGGGIVPSKLVLLLVLASLVKPLALYSAKHITSAPGHGCIIVKPWTLYSAKHITSAPGLGCIIVKPQTLYSAKHITSAPGLGFIIVKPWTLYFARHITSAPGHGCIIVKPQTLYSARHITSAPGLGFISKASSSLLC